jgi:hypothetical protein
VVAFFNPSITHTSNTLHTEIQEFIANDVISLREFFGDWEKHYHPKSGQNIALQSLRVDIGGFFYKDFYMGYFYRYDVFIKTEKDFADLYHKIKNKQDFPVGRAYNLDLRIDGVKESGIMLAKRVVLYHDRNRQLHLGVGLSFLFGHDMQDGYSAGSAYTPSEKVYEITAHSAYNYTYNYLYDLDVSDASGVGFGSDISLVYHDSDCDFDASIVVNDLLSKIYWRDLPYSYVAIETKNKSFDSDGYIKYAPSISGLEEYRNTIQTLEPRVKLFFEKGVYHDMRVGTGVSFAYGENFPYFCVAKDFSKWENIALSYESRFRSFGVDYHDRFFHLGVSSDALSDASALGLRAGFMYRF